MKARNYDYDLIVIGGGIYGIMLALEASLRKLRVLLLERNDWGSGTTANWLRILHGGLRYLQSADLPRFYESVRERRWFLEHFPEFVQPLPCIMPLYRTGSHSPLLMRAALAANDALSLHRNRRLLPERRLPAGKLINRNKVLDELPFVDSNDLTGGALWYDAIATEPERLLMELLNWARHNGVHALNNTEALGVTREDGLVTGVTVRSVSGEDIREYSAPTVVNATGHCSLGLASRLGSTIEKPPRSSWAWNLLLDIPNEAQSAAAVTARRPGAQTLFVLPWHGRTLIGTGHAPTANAEDGHSLPEFLVEQFLAEIDEAVPRLSINSSRVERVLAGRLPLHPSLEELSKRPLLVDHCSRGFGGLYTIWGIKYTTARILAQKLIRKAFPHLSAGEHRRPTPSM